MLRDEIVGAWRLVSYTAQGDGGGPVFYPLGADAVGLIIYTDDGYMSAQLMRPNRSPQGRSDLFDPNQVAMAASDYLAYAGPYRVDDATGAVYHMVAISLLPNWTDTTQLRYATLDGDRLTLIANVPLGDTTIRATLAWERTTASTTAAGRDDGSVTSRNT